VLQRLKAGLVQVNAQSPADLVSDLYAVTERDSIVYTSPNVKGLGLQFSYYNELNAQHYAATHPEILKPVGNYAFTAMQYDTGTSAAVAYKSSTYRSFVMGFPLECIIDERTRTSVLLGILKFLTD
jgi:hypothetical protein